MHEHYLEDESGELIEVVALCSDACHRQWCDDNGEPYPGWSGAHETEFTNWCQSCGVVIPGEDACEHQFSNVVVNRFPSYGGERCEHGNWIQVPLSYVSA